jgi:hypothetical protein
MTGDGQADGIREKEGASPLTLAQALARDGTRYG